MLYKAKKTEPIIKEVDKLRKCLLKNLLYKKSAFFARQVSEWGVPLKRVVQFGSYTKNTQHKWSDIDVALVADSFNGAGFYDIALFGKTLIKKPFRSIQPKT